jgi:hypothetical protein
MAIMPVERGKIREYATATSAARPAYLDDPKAPVPPTFLATVVFWTPIGETLRSPEVLRACAGAGVAPDLGSLLSLEQEYVYHGRRHTGDAADRRAADRHHREADPRRPGDGRGPVHPERTFGPVTLTDIVRHRPSLLPPAGGT